MEFYSLFPFKFEYKTRDFYSYLFLSIFRQDQCTSCFKDAVKNAMKKGSKPDTEAMKSGLSACATQYLDTKYAACNAMMQDASSDKKEGFECYIRELVKSLVQKCSAAENIRFVDRSK